MFGFGTFQETPLYFSDYLIHDRAIRAAIGDCSAEEFREILTELYNFDDHFNANLTDSYCYSNTIIRLILSSRGLLEKLKVFYEVINDRIHLSIDKPIEYALLIGCLNNDDETAEYIIREQLHYLDFYRDIYFIEPFYFLMITGKYELIPAALERLRSCLNARGSSDINLGKFINTAASAAYFGDKEFLKAWFEGGYQIDKELILRLYPYPEAIEFIVREFYDKLGFDKPVGIYEFIKECFNADEILDLAYDINSCYGEEIFEQFAAGLRPIKKTHILHSDTLWRYTMSAPQANMTSVELFLMEFLDEKLTVVMQDNSAYPFFLEAKRLLKGHSIIYDMTNCTDAYFFWNISISELIDLLKTSDFIFPESAYVDMMFPILKKNSKTITKMLIKKGIINKDNYEELLDCLVSEKLINVLAVINNSEIMK